MRRLTLYQLPLPLALLLLAATQTAVLGKRTERAARRAPGRANQAAAHKTERAAPRRVAPDSKAALTTKKTAGRPKATVAAATRDDVTPSARASSGGRGRRATAKRGARTLTLPSGETLTLASGPVVRSPDYRNLTASDAPLLYVGGKNKGKKVTEDFTVREHTRSGKEDPPYARLDLQHSLCIQAIRDYVGKPVYITSGYRTPKYNRELYERRGKRPTKTQHSGGRASDVRIAGMSGLQVAKVALDACGTDVSIGVGKDFAHIDSRGYFTTWGYGVSQRQLAEVRKYRDATYAASRARDPKPRRGKLAKGM